MMAGADGPPDPFTGLAEIAASTAELYKAHVEAGMPPAAVAIMLGQMLAAMAAASGQEGQ
jgi:hypothetical protein